MGRIKILSPAVRRKIAAGEVISRPASVVKELIENSLDAQAQRIELDIREGGKRMCLVNDNGCGMCRDDALLAVERYGTSKIDTIDDIEHINTYGFRGEALASITQVSFFELETSDGNIGTRLNVEDGEVKAICDSHRPRGTRVKVSDLFFNLPARLKFLKSAQWERRLIIDLVKTYSLIHPTIYFMLGESGRSIFELIGVDSIEQRIKMLFSKSIVESLVDVEVNTGTVSMYGYFSRPDFSERHHMNHLYVNSRPVRYPRIYRAIVNAYENPKNLPAFILNIVVEPNFVDVNIHPTKNEVKFRDERYITDVLVQSIKKQLFSRMRTATYTAMDKGLDQDTLVSRKAQFAQDMLIPYTSEQRTKPETARDSEEFWQLHDTYILAQTKSGFIIVDQHVAHERIIYESIMRGRSGAQRLLFPITLELAPEEYRVYKQTKPTLSELGVEFKEFSSRTIVCDSLPTGAQVNREDIVGLFKELDGLGNLIKEKSEIAKVVACRSAIKVGQRLSVVEMQSLIDRLFACENPYTCPHGRPIVVRFALDELANKFGRESSGKL